MNCNNPSKLLKSFLTRHNPQTQQAPDIYSSINSSNLTISSTVVCHDLVSKCLDIMSSTETTTLKLKVTQPENNEENPEFGNWAFLLQTGDDVNKESCYSHQPVRNPSFSALSSKSLDLCTENLGSETGSDIVTDGISIFSCSPPLSPSSNSAAGYSAFDLFGGDSDKETEAVWGRPNSYKIRGAPRAVRDFPPPLTTLTGPNSLRVRRRTAEGGRLIIEAVETPFRNSYLQAERSDGRLRLCFVTAEPPCSTSDEEGEENDDDEAEEIGGETTADAPIDDSKIEFESGEEIDREKEKEKFWPLSRCKDGSHNREGLGRNWNLWVATS